MVSAVVHKSTLKETAVVDLYVYCSLEKKKTKGKKTYVGDVKQSAHSGVKGAILDSLHAPKNFLLINIFANCLFLEKKKNHRV